MDEMDRRLFLHTLARLSMGAGAAYGAVSLAACGGSDDSAASSSAVATGAATGSTAPATPGGTVVVGLRDAAANFDPGKAGIEPNVRLALYDSLMSVAPNGALVPGLAGSITPSSDFTQWTLKVRPGVTFHDGTPFDAASVVANLEAARAAPFTSAGLAMISAVDATDESTVVIDLSEQWSPFPSYLAGQGGAMVQPDILAAGTSNDMPVGTGPFVFGEWVPDSSFSATRHEGYWGEGLPYLDRIEYRAIADSQTLINSLQAGDIDVLLTFEPFIIDAFANDDQFVTTTSAEREFGVPSQLFYLMNTAAAPTDDIRVRRAMAHAVDRAAIVASLGKGIPAISDGIFPAESVYYTPSGYPEFDLDAARALVDDYSAEKGPISIEIFTSNSPQEFQLAQLVQGMVAEAGIEATVKQLQVAEITQNGLFGTYQVTSWGGFGVADPDQLSVGMSSANAKPVGELAANPARYQDDEIDAAFVAGRATDVESERVAAYQTVQRRIGELVPYLWLYTPVFAAITTRAVGGVDLSIPTTARPANLHTS